MRKRIRQSTKNAQQPKQLAGRKMSVSYKDNVRQVFAAASRKAAKSLEGYERATKILKDKHKRELNERIQQKQ